MEKEVREGRQLLLVLEQLRQVVGYALRVVDGHVVAVIGVTGAEVATADAVAVDVTVVTDVAVAARRSF